MLVELGTGDGQLLAKILEYGNSPNTCYVGIEIDPKQIQKARHKLRGRNIYLINESFENALPYFPDNYVDEFIFVLPSPRYINKSMEWKKYFNDLFLYTFILCRTIYGIII